MNPTGFPQAYFDEFGAIESSVYEAALQLWPRVEHEALHILRDSDAGQQLLMKACAQVTRRRAEAEIANLPGYLYRAWRRLLLAELEKQNSHRRIEESLAAAAQLPQHSAEELDRRILLQQIVAQMDEWTRRVFEALTLGFTYDEIATELGGNGHAVRVKYDRQIKALAKQLNQPGDRG